MTVPTPTELEGLLEQSGFTHLVADFVPDGPGLEGVEPGWRIHDFPPNTIFAMFLAGGLEEAQAKVIVAAVNALPSLIARIKDLSEALEPFANCADQIADTEDDEEWAKFRLLIKDYRRAALPLNKDSTHAG